jgi:ABC-type multidrug transport system fused ATPase/permease subunit
VKGLFPIAKSLFIRLPKSSRKKINLLLPVYLFTSFLDLIGIAILGSVAALAFKYISGENSPTRLELLISQHFSHNYSTVTLILFSIAIATTFLITKSLLQLYLNYKLMKFMAKLETQLSESIFNLIINSDLALIHANNYAHYQAMLTFGANKYIMGIIFSAIMLITDVFSSIAMLSFSLYASFVPTLLVCTILLIAYLAFNGPIIAQAKKYGVQSLLINNALTENFLEAFRGIKEIKAYRMHAEFENEFAQTKYNSALLSQKITWLNGLIRYFLEISILLAGIISIFFLILTVDSRHAVTSAVILIVVGYRLIPNIQRIQNSINAIRISEGYIKPIYDLFNESKSSSTSFLIEPDQTKFQVLDELQVKELSFSFEAQAETIKNLSFILRKNQTLGIVGVSGSGKSTLLDLLLGIQAPTSGEINFLSSNIKYKSFDFKFSYISQNCPLFGEDIYQNVCMTKNYSNSEVLKINNILAILGLERFIGAKNEKRSQVRSDGTNVSGGERQRLSIARAIYFESDILVLDEPTSALDQENSKTVLNFLEGIRNTKTVIFATHDNTLVKNADLVLFLRNGVGIFFGTPDDYFKFINNL